MPDTRTVIYRVDPRLVHATLTNAWVPALKIEQLLVADGSVADDPRRRTIVQIAATDVGRVLFAAEADAAAALDESSGATVVLFSTLMGVERAIAGGLKVDVLNIGHIPVGPGREEHLPSVFLGPDEIASIARLQAHGIRVELRALPDDEPVVPAAPADDHHRAEGTFEIVNERGLHLRAAHVLAALCNKLPNDVEVGRENYMVNAKSLLGLTALGAAAGTRLKVVVTGPGAVEGLRAIEALFASGFDEGIAPGRRT